MQDFYYCLSGDMFQLVEYLLYAVTLYFVNRSANIFLEDLCICFVY
jgi:hypothetical protein